MRKLLLFALLLWASAAHGADVKVYFAPGPCTDVIVAEIGKATHEVLVQAYGFTSAPIAAALRDANRRGVSVRVVLDSSNETSKYTGATFLENAGIPVLIDAAHAIAHNKVMVIDREVVITGSFNFTSSAEKRNAENLLVIRNAPEVVRAYVDNYHFHAEHSKRYQRLIGPAPAVNQVAMPKPVQPTAVAGPQPIQDTVYATKSGRKYHRAGCTSLRSSAIPMTRSQAAAAGLSPCSVCRP